MLGILGEVSDEGEFWETRSLERLTKEIGEQSAMLAGFLGVLKDAVGQAPGGTGTVEAPIAAYPHARLLARVCVRPIRRAGVLRLREGGGGGEFVAGSLLSGAASRTGVELC